MTSDPQAVARILCGTDGSSDAKNAVAFTARLAQQLHAEVVLVHAIGLLEHLPVDRTDLSVSIGDWAREQLRTEWSGPLRERGIDHRCIAEDGPPLLALPRVAKRVNADLIVVASHGRGAASSLPLGSTAHGLVQLVNLPIVVVPGGERRA